MGRKDKGGERGREGMERRKGEEREKGEGRKGKGEGLRHGCYGDKRPCLPINPHFRPRGPENPCKY